MKRAKKADLPDLPWQEETAYGFALLEATLNDPRMDDGDLRKQVKFVVGVYGAQTPIHEARQRAIRLWLDMIYAARPRSAFSIVEGGKR
jgi:hypothetical protein